MVVIGMRVGHLAPTVGVKRTPMRIPIPVQPNWAVAECGGGARYALYRFELSDGGAKFLRDRVHLATRVVAFVSRHVGFACQTAFLNDVQRS